MAQVLKDRISLRQLLASLTSNSDQGWRGDELPVIGVLKSVLTSLVYYEAVVDSWPQWRALVLRPNRDKMTLQTWLPRPVWLWVYYRDDVRDLERLLGNNDILPRKEQFMITACPTGAVNTIKDVVQQCGGHLEIDANPCNVFIQGWGRKEAKHPEGFTLGSLSPEDAALVNGNWEYKNEHTEAFIAYQLQVLPSWVVRDNQGRSVHWAMRLYDGSCGMGFTLPEYRNKGLGQISQPAGTKAHKQMMEVPFCYVSTTNKASQTVMVKNGATRLPQQVTWINYTPRALQKSHL